MKKKVKSKKKKYKLSYQKIVVFLLIIIFVLIIYNIISNLNKENESIQTASLIDNEALKDIETSSYANISRYIVYGTHLNLEGDIEFNENTSIENAGIVVKNVSGEEMFANSRTPLYMVIGENDSYYGSTKTKNAYNTIYELYQKQGLTNDEINSILVLDVKDHEYFTSKGFSDEHAGCGSFAYEEEIMNWIFSKIK